MKTLLGLLLVLALQAMAEYPYIPGHFPEWKDHRLPHWNGTFGRFYHWPPWMPGYGIESALALLLDHTGEEGQHLRLVSAGKNLLRVI